jgi:hypothetical protein
VSDGQPIAGDSTRRTGVHSEALTPEQLEQVVGGAPGVNAPGLNAPTVNGIISPRDTASGLVIGPRAKP